MTSPAFSSRRMPTMIRRASAASAPSEPAARSRAALFKLLQVLAEILQSDALESRGGRAQFLPVGLFGHQRAALGLDHIDGVGHILAQLRVAAAPERCRGKWRRQPGSSTGCVTANSAAHA